MKSKRPKNGRSQLVNRVVKRLRQSYRPIQIILFGSYAHGHPGPDSDLDLLIVKQTPKSFYQRLFDVRRLVSPVLGGHPFDPIVMTPAELERRLAIGDQFLRGIVTTGKTVYDGR